MLRDMQDFDWAPCGLPPASRGIRQFPMSFFVSGEGYQTAGLAVQVSIGILFLYCVVTIAHIVLSIGLRISSTSLNSVTEVVALGLKPRRPPELQNTCAGIISTGVFQIKDAVNRLWRDPDTKGSDVLIYFTIHSYSASSERCLDVLVLILDD